jgi:hypothetical protein
LKFILLHLLANFPQLQLFKLPKSYTYSQNPKIFNAKNPPPYSLPLGTSQNKSAERTGTAHGIYPVCCGKFDSVMCS